MNPPETEPESGSRATYFDPDQFDMSEQQFEVSLEQRNERPRFVVAAETSKAGLEAARQSGLDKDDTQASGSFVIDAAETTPSTPAHQNSSTHIETSSDEEQVPNTEPDWRDLVSAKVSSYKSRRPRKDRYPSLQLQFEPAQRRQRIETDDHDFDFTSSRGTFPTSENSSRRAETEPPIVLEATARVLEFPRPVSVPVRTDELAEPVIDRPRIVEAPELVPPPPAMGGILIEETREPEPERRPGFDMPLQSAALRQKIFAAVMDGLVITAATGLFGYVVLRIIGFGPGMPWRTEADVIAGLLAVLWPVYQYAFVVHCGTTPGLHFAKLKIQRFDGTTVPRNLRRWRVLASVLSAASLGLGYMWCFLDEDRLSWHDRITKTHLAAYKTPDFAHSR